MTARRTPRHAVALAIIVSLAPVQAMARQSETPPDATGAAASRPDAAQDDSERWWDRYVDAHAWLGDRGIHPQAGVVVSGSSLAFGVRYHRPRILDSPLGVDVSGMWSVRGYDEYRLRTGLIDRLDATLTLRPADAKVSSQFNDFAERSSGAAVYVDLLWRDYPRVNFYGLGPTVRLDDRSDFRLRGYSADLVGQWQTGTGFGVAARAGVLGFDIMRGSNDAVPDLQDAFDPGRIPGALDQPVFATFGLSGVFDRRNSAAVPTSGPFVGVSAWRLESLGGDDEGAVRVVADGRRYFTPFTPDDVLAVRGVLSSELNDGPTPFYLQYHLGGSETLRGYPSYLFRDRAMLQVSAEYRWRAGTLLEIAPFVDLGLVGPDLAALRAEHLEATPGVGFRVRNDDRVLFRMDVGYRPGAIRFTFSTGPAF
jgi:hypothetical protein